MPGIVAIAYVMQKTPYVFPIVGGRKVEHLMDNIDALNITLSEDQIKYLEGILPFDAGFPTNVIVSITTLVPNETRSYVYKGDGTAYGGFVGVQMSNMAKWPHPQAIRP